MKTIRCAIYTRKSNEEGLEQAFNSLNAQRQAGVDYIKIQKHEDWSVIKTHYDDGGFSGGTMKRPTLEQLIEDIECGRVDIIVVYKVDRLSRSLTDFSRMVQVFDKHKVSFVSVTQQFNTTNSMGRLTLNMLLSFAQFEREVTGERIRDKIAATKKNDSGQKRIVRYYISQKGIKRGFKACPIKSINANHLDDLARGIVLDYLNRKLLENQSLEIRDHWIREVIDSVTLDPDKLTLRLNTKMIERLRINEFPPTGNECQPRPTCAYKPHIEDRGKLIHLMLDIQIKKLDGRRMILSPDGHDLVFPSIPEPKQHIVDAIGLAYRWHHEIMETKLSLRDYADQNHIARTRLLKLLPLTYLSPEILRHALIGTLAPSITLSDLLQAAEQLDWNHQAQSLGLNRPEITTTLA